MIKLKVNGKEHSVDVTPDTPLLWVIRERLRLTGTKYGCGIGQCGACTVHIDGASARACGVSVGDAVGHKITTIEGLDPESKHPLQLAWIAEQVPQCGYCTSGWIMTAAALLRDKPKPTDKQIRDAFAGLKCRCGTHMAIMRAVKRAAGVTA